jgi:hypothetical protein
MRRRDFFYRAVQGTAALGVLRHLGACRPSRSAAPFASIRDRYFLRSLQLNPVVSTYLGGDGYDPILSAANGTLRDYRPEALQDEGRFYRGIRDELGRINRSTLQATEAVDYDVLQAQLAFLLHQLEDVRHYQRAIDSYIAEPFRGVDWQLQQMQSFPAGRLGRMGSMAAGRTRNTSGTLCCRPPAGTWEPEGSRGR